MTPEHWQVVKRMVESALGRPPGEREAFVVTATAGNDSLRHEVESLIAAYENGGDLLDKSPSLQQELRPGRTLGHYEIVEMIGEGGMGEVYRARDRRLGRDVALKILPVHFASDPQMKVRFEREAKAVSALNHPHICTLYDVGSDQGIDYLAMEYIEGETLAKRLARGPIPLVDVIRFGTEIADALDKAHRKGLVHRDLKPSNVMITKSGAKLLDFGLAKTTRPSIWDRSASFAETAEKPITGSGTLVGTLEFMAPEQLQGKDADARTDIFALGNLLYRMVTGKRPFEAESHASLVAAILEHEPPSILTVDPAQPLALDRLIRACLAKDPDERIQSAHDVMLELKWITASAQEPPRVKIGSQGRWLLWAVAVISLITAVAAVVQWRRTSSTEARAPKRFTITLPDSAPLVLMDPINNLAVSPDGKRIAYVGGRGEHRRLFVREIASAAVTALPGTDGAMSPFFSPDGQSIGFFAVDGADQKLKKVSSSGGSPLELCDVFRPRSAAWSPDGTIFFKHIGFDGLLRVSSDGGKPATFTRPPRNTVHGDPTVLPGGEYILYVSSGGIEARSLRTGQTHVVVRQGRQPRYVEPGYLLYTWQGDLWAVRFSLSTARPTSAPIVVETNLFRTGFVSLAAFFATSLDGTIFYVTHPEENWELVWMDRRGKAKPISSRKASFRSPPRLSPAGDEVAVSIGQELWLYEIKPDRWRRLTPDGHTPLYFPEGDHLLYSSFSTPGDYHRSGGGLNLFAIPTDGRLAPRQITSSHLMPYASSWTPDGQWVIGTEQRKETGWDIVLIPIDRRGTPKSYLATKASERSPAVSPDGKWIAYESNDSGRFEVYVQEFARPGQRWQVSADGGVFPKWSLAGTELFYVARKSDQISMMAVEVRFRPLLQASRPRELFSGTFAVEFDVAADGRFAMINRPQRPITQINVWEGFWSQIDGTAR